MNIALFNFSDNFFKEVVDQLLLMNIYIKYIFTTKSFLYNNDKYKDIMIINPLLFYNIKDINSINLEFNLSKKIVDKYCKCENLFLTISDRFSYYPISVRERKRIYKKLLNYWINFVSNNNIDIFLFNVTPHMGWDNIAYDVAQENNVKTYFFMRTLLNNKLLIIDNFDNLEKVPNTFEKYKNKDEIKNKIDSDLIKNLHKDSDWIKYSKSINDKVLNKNRLYFLNKNNIKMFIKNLRKIFIRKKPSAFYYNKMYRNFYIRILNINHIKKIKKLRKIYNKLSTNVSLNKKYCFFALNFQPERSTIPEGDIFEDQLMAISILSKSIPEDYVIYVKEHPRQFDINRLNLKNKHFRSEDYYLELNSIEKVCLINLGINNNDLISGAKFVSTITGSVGWESLLKNKPVIVFGNPWYLPCNSCYKVESVEDCKDAISKIMIKNNEEVELDLLKYILYYQKKFINSTNSHKFAISSESDYKELVINFANAIRSLI